MASDVFPHAVDVFTTDQRCALGQTFRDGSGRVFKYVQFDDAVAYVSGAVVSIKDGDGGTVTADESAGTDRPGGVVAASLRGATQKVPTENQYGLVQLKGRHPAVAKAAGVDSIADGKGLMLHATTDGVANVYTTPTVAEMIRGIGYAAGTSEDTASGTYNEDTVPANLDIEEWGQVVS